MKPTDAVCNHLDWWLPGRLRHSAKSQGVFQLWVAWHYVQYVALPFPEPGAPKMHLSISQLNFCDLQDVHSRIKLHLQSWMAQSAPILCLNIGFAPSKHYSILGGGRQSMRPWKCLLRAWSMTKSWSKVQSAEVTNRATGLQRLLRERSDLFAAGGSTVFTSQ